MNDAVWRQHIPGLAELFRLPVDDGATGVRAEQPDLVEKLHDDLAKLVFAGAQDWVDLDHGWLAAQLATRLDDTHGAHLVGLLTGGNDTDVITYLAGHGVATMLTAGDATAAAVADDLTGTDNSANWAANRLPGTLYYAFDGTEYRFGDEPSAPATGWRTVEERQQEAADRAQAWGAGWCTPAGGDSRYGGAYVYAVNKAGPWLTQDEVTPLLAATPAADVNTDTAIQPWGEVWAKHETGEWRYSLTEHGPWTYTDGDVAVREKAILDTVTATLLTQYPNADVDYVRAMAAQYVAETS